MEQVRKGWRGFLCIAAALLLGSLTRLEARAAVPPVTEKAGTATWEQSGTVSYTFEYDMDAGNAVVTGITYSGTGKGAAVTVPAQMQVSYQSKTKKLAAVGIGDGTASCIRNTGTGSVASVTLPAGMKEIGKGAFQGYGALAAFNTGNGVERIGEAAFAGCTALDTLTLGEGVREVGRAAFTDAPLAKMVTFNCITLLEGDSLFKGHTGITKFTLGSKVTVVPDGLFAGCTGITATALTIPDSVSYLGSNAFDSCKRVETITLGKGLLELGREVFRSAYPLYEHTPEGIAKNKNSLKFNCTNLSDVRGNFKTLEERIAVRYGGSITVGSNVQAVPDEIRELMRFPDTTKTGKPGAVVSYTAPYTGRYLLQAWGAAGGGGASGGYSYGYYDMVKGEVLYLYTGTSGKLPKKTERAAGGFNGGGDGTLGAGSGGGATDFRTEKAKGSSGWNDRAKGTETPENLKEDASLSSRILVAGGGGGEAANGRGVTDAKGNTADRVVGTSSLFGVGGGASAGASQGVSGAAGQSGGYSPGMGQDSCTVQAPTGHPGESATSTYGGAGGGGYYGGGQSSCGRYTKLKKEDGTEMIAEVGGSGGGGSGYLGGVYGVDKSYEDGYGDVKEYQDIGTFAGIPCYPDQTEGGEALSDSSSGDVIYGPDRQALKASGARQGDGAASITYTGTVSSRVTLTVEKKAGSFGGKQSITLEGYALYNRMLPEPEMTGGYQFLRYEAYSGDGSVQQDGSYTHGFQDTELRAVFSGELKLTQQVNSTANQGKGAVDLSWSEDDDFVKVFYVQQSTDRVHWSNLGDSGQGVEEVEEGFIRDKANSHGSRPGQACRRSYTIPYTGVYYITAAGGSGGVAHGGSVQGVGGLVKGKLSLKKGAVLTIELGGRGGNANGGSAEGPYQGQGGFNGGGSGLKWDEEASFWGTGAGGGGTRILVDGISVIIAGGGGGGNADGGGAGAGGNTIKRIADRSQDKKVISGGDAGDREKGGGGGGFAKGFQSYGGSSFFNEGGTITARLLSSRGGGAKTLKLPDSLKGKYSSNDGTALLESLLTFPELSDNRYTAYTPDTAPPDAPGGGKAERLGGGIGISWEAPEDNGSVYYHRVGSCCDGGLTELRMSEVLQSPEVCSGVAGYYYYIDQNPVGTAGRGNSTYSTSCMGAAAAEDNGKYVHVAAADRAGNLGPTYSFLIDAPAEYRVTFHGNGNWNGEQDSYTQTLTCDRPEKLLACKFTRKAPNTINGVTYKEGYRFLGWSLSPASTEVRYADQEEVRNIGTANQNLDLYAVWSKEITLTFRLMGGNIGGSKKDVVLKHTIKNDKYDTYFNLMSEFDAYGSYDGNGINQVFRKRVNETTYLVTLRVINKGSYYWNTYQQKYEEAKVYLKIPLAQEGDLHPVVQTHVH